MVKKVHFIQTLNSMHVQIVTLFGEEVNLEMVLRVLRFSFNNNLLSLLGIGTMLFSYLLF